MAGRVTKSAENVDKGEDIVFEQDRRKFKPFRAIKRIFRGKKKSKDMSQSMGSIVFSNEEDSTSNVPDFARSMSHESVFRKEGVVSSVSDDHAVLRHALSVGDVAEVKIPIDRLKASVEVDGPKQTSLDNDVNRSSPEVRSDNKPKEDILDIEMNDIPVEVPRLNNKAAYDKIALRPKRRPAKSARGTQQQHIVRVQANSPHVNGVDEGDKAADDFLQNEFASKDAPSSPQPKKSRPQLISPTVPDVEKTDSDDAVSRTTPKRHVRLAKSPLGAGPAGFVPTLQDVQAFKLRPRQGEGATEAQNSTAKTLDSPKAKTKSSGEKSPKIGRKDPTLKTPDSPKTKSKFTEKIKKSPKTTKKGTPKKSKQEQKSGNEGGTSIFSWKSKSSAPKSPTPQKSPKTPRSPRENEKPKSSIFSGLKPKKHVTEKEPKSPSSAAPKVFSSGEKEQAKKKTSETAKDDAIRRKEDDSAAFKTKAEKQENVKSANIPEVESLIELSHSNSDVSDSSFSVVGEKSLLDQINAEMAEKKNISSIPVKRENSLDKYKTKLQEEAANLAENRVDKADKPKSPNNDKTSFKAKFAASEVEHKKEQTDVKINSERETSVEQKPAVKPPSISNPSSPGERETSTELNPEVKLPSISDKPSPSVSIEKESKPTVGPKIPEVKPPKTTVISSSDEKPKPDLDIKANSKTGGAPAPTEISKEVQPEALNDEKISKSSEETTAKEVTTTKTGKGSTKKNSDSPVAEVAATNASAVGVPPKHEPTGAKTVETSSVKTPATSGETPANADFVKTAVASGETIKSVGSVEISVGNPASESADSVKTPDGSVDSVTTPAIGNGTLVSVGSVKSPAISNDTSKSAIDKPKVESKTLDTSKPVDLKGDSPVKKDDRKENVDAKPTTNKKKTHTRTKSKSESDSVPVVKERLAVGDSVSNEVSKPEITAQSTPTLKSSKDENVADPIVKSKSVSLPQKSGKDEKIEGPTAEKKFARARSASARSANESQPALELFSRDRLKPVADNVPNRKTASFKVMSGKAMTRSSLSRPVNVDSGNSGDKEQKDFKSWAKLGNSNEKTKLPSPAPRSVIKKDKPPVAEKPKSPVKSPSKSPLIIAATQDAANNNVKLPAIPKQAELKSPVSSKPVPVEIPREAEEKPVAKSNPKPVVRRVVHRQKKDDSGDENSQPSWVLMAQRRSKVWEESVHIPQATSKSAPSISTSDDNRPTTLAVASKARAESISKPDTATSKSSPASPSFKVQSNRTASIPAIGSVPARKVTPTDNQTPSAGNGQPSWLKIAMQKQKSWGAKEETV